MASRKTRKRRLRAHSILKALSGSLKIRDEDFSAVLVARKTRDPFRVLVVTILSQSCTDISAMRAFDALDHQVGCSSSELSNANIRNIEQAIRVAGLYHQKAKAIKELSQIICDKYAGDINQLLDLPLEAARQRLQELPKVGPKTADVLLSIWGLPTISVDTHVDRVSKRLGFTNSKSKYEEVRHDLMSLFNANDYSRIPLLFMAHGRTYCKAIRPRCSTCPVEKQCRYSMKTIARATPARGIPRLIKLATVSKRR